MKVRGVHNILVGLLCVLMLVTPMGCATTSTTQAKKIQPVSLRQGHIPNNVAVIGVPSAPAVELRKPWGKFKGAFIGVGKGALEALGDSAEVVDDSGNGEVALFLFTVLYTITGPIYMVKGGVSGALQGLSREEIGGAAAAIGAAIQHTDTQMLLSERTTAVLAASGIALNATIIDTVPEGGYTSLRVLGYDSVLELSVLQMGLRGGDGADPPLAFFMKVRARLIRSEDNTVLYDKIIEYSKGSMAFTSWGQSEASEFVKEMNTAINTIANQIVSEVFSFGQSTASPGTTDAGYVSRP